MLILVAVSVNAVFRDVADNYIFSANWNTPLNVNDSDWGTGSGSTGTAYVFINYSKRLNSSGTPIWQVKDTYATTNETLGGCADDPLQLEAVLSAAGDCKWFCYNGASWTLLRQKSSCPTIYEEGVFWSEVSTIDDCSVLGSVILNFSAKDENDLTDLDITLDLDILTEGYDYSKSYSLVDSKVVCIDKYLDTMVSGSVRYGHPEAYDEFYYFIIPANRSNNITLYPLNSTNSSATEVLATVIDETNNPVQAAYIRALRYYYDDNTYKLIEMGKTNWEGETRLHLIKHSEYYRFLIYYNQTTLIKSTTPAQIYADSNQINFQIRLNNPVGQNYNTLVGIDNSLTFNNDTDNFRFIYSDQSGTNREYCIRVYKQTASSSIMINSSCVTGAAGVLLVGVPHINGTTYNAKVHVELGAPYLIASMTHTYQEEPVLGLMGIFVVLILTLVFAFVAFWSVTIAAVVVPLPILFGSITGMIAVPFGIAIIPLIIGIIIAIMIGGRT